MQPVETGTKNDSHSITRVLSAFTTLALRKANLLELLATPERTELCHQRAPAAARVALSLATPAQRERFEIGRFGVHWPEIDEDIKLAGLLLGAKASGATPPGEVLWPPA